MRHERGFSLVELIVAMTVTLIVSSAIYGLLAAGGNAFRREPEVADRQQNIRAAMDMIARDVFGAGAALPSFAQVFSSTDPAGGCPGPLDGCGQPGSMGLGNTDVLQIVSTDEQCPHQSICSAGPLPGVAGPFVSEESVPQCLRVPSLVLLVNDLSFTIQAATATGGAGTCPGAGVTPPNGNLTLTAGLPPFNLVFPGPSNPYSSVSPAGNSVYMYRARLVRYRVAPNTDPLDPAPSLWRTESGLYNPDGSAAPEPSDAGFNPLAPLQPWQLVARGIEDMQIEYLDGSGAGWQNQPPVSLPDDWTTLVRQVRITLSARATQAGLGGESSALGGAPDAVRGQLSTVVAPRAARYELQMCTGATLSPACTAAMHIQ